MAPYSDLESSIFESLSSDELDSFLSCVERDFYEEVRRSKKAHGKRGVSNHE